MKRAPLYHAGNNDKQLIDLLDYIHELEPNYIAHNVDGYFELTNGRYQWVPLAVYVFLDLMNEALKHTDNKQDIHFVDVGSGIGTKLMLAEYILTSAGKNVSLSGIEIDQKLVDVSKQLVPQANIKVGNALDMDYGEYDVVYLYHPFIDNKLQKQLDERIAKTIKTGAIVVLPLNTTDGYNSLKRVFNHFNAYSEDVFKKE